MPQNNVKILHVASFVGNIGDNASHKGFYNILNQHLETLSITELEIRKFYKNYNKADKHFFDERFIEYANSFDMLVIGGGGFLDYWVPNSATGTTIDIEPNLIDKLKVKTLITSVGCIPHKEIPDGNIDKFRTFLDALLSNKNIHLSVRNDGSKLILKNEIGMQYHQAIPEVLDSGFFYDNNIPIGLPLVQPYVAINITDDQIHMISNSRLPLDIDGYYAEMVKVTRFIINDLKMNIVFVPHIHSDLRAINNVIQLLNDFEIRQKVIVAPCLQGYKGADFLFSIYKHSHISISSRLHANICCLAMSSPVIGLAVLDRVQHIYKSINNDDFVLPEINYSSELISKLVKFNNEYSSEYIRHNSAFKNLNIYFDTKKFYANKIF